MTTSFIQRLQGGKKAKVRPKLSAQLVIELYMEYAAGTTVETLAEKYNMPVAAVCKALQGKGVRAQKVMEELNLQPIAEPHRKQKVRRCKTKPRKYSQEIVDYMFNLRYLEAMPFPKISEMFAAHLGERLKINTIWQLIRGEEKRRAKLKQ
jgi:hypothetical protein